MQGDKNHHQNQFKRPLNGSSSEPNTTHKIRVNHDRKQWSDLQKQRKDLPIFAGMWHEFICLFFTTDQISQLHYQQFVIN